jgi:predicted DNA-binding protein (MmcQ/YjbR family)
MTIDQLRALCMQRKGVTEDIKWEEHLCFSVAAKMFLIISIDDIPVNATFKVPEEDFDEMLSQEMFSKAPHLGRYHWVLVNDINKLSRKEWEHYIHQSYDLVAAKLPAKKRQELGI